MTAEMTRGLIPGDPVLVYDGGPGLVTRLEGWALSVLEMIAGDGPQATRRQMVAVFRDADGNPDVSSPLVVVPLDAAAGGWHLVAADGRIVAGGPLMTRERMEELRGTRARYTGASVIHGIPDVAQRSKRLERPGPPPEGAFTASRGGWYRAYDPQTGQLL